MVKIMSKVHLSIEQINSRIEELTEELSKIKEDKEQKHKKLRIYRQLSKLNKALKDPDFRVDPAEVKERIDKRRAKKEKKIENLAQKHQKQYELGILPKNQAKMSCINCKQQGHVIKNCPLLDKREVYCYSCSSRNHTSKDCTETGYKFATCFYCNGVGHLASKCTQRPEQGIYPNGGGCHRCGSVWHLSKNCPDNKK